METRGNEGRAPPPWIMHHRGNTGTADGSPGPAVVINASNRPEFMANLWQQRHKKPGSWELRPDLESTLNPSAR